MNSWFRISMSAVLLSVLVASTGCSTISRWFGWDESGDETAGMVPPPTTDLQPGPWSEAGMLPPGTRAGWNPIPGMTLPTVYFAYDQSTIGTTEQAKLEQVANILLQQKDVNVIIEGNCDERGSSEYNRSLGERRALAVKVYLAKLGIADTRMQTQSYGEDKPAVQGADESAYAKNRRADLIAAK